MMSEITVKNFIDQPDATGDNALNLKGTINRNELDVSSDMVFVKEVTVTADELNAGVTLMNSAVGRYLQILNISAHVTGTFADCTDVAILAAYGLPLLTINVAALVDDALLTNLEALSPNVIRGAGMMQELAVNEFIYAYCGVPEYTGTSITFFITYKVR